MQGQSRRSKKEPDYKAVLLGSILGMRNHNGARVIPIKRAQQIKREIGKK